MTVAELIRKLQAFDPNAEAVIVFPSVGEQHEIGGLWISEPDDDDERSVEIAVDE
jgi:hypothetical protein